ncbi:MAG TPA: DUF3598 family protein [Halomicronema sp.]
MSSQLKNFLKNSGEWLGSFTVFSTSGEVMNDVKSFLIIEGLNNNEKVKFTLRRWISGESEPPNELVREFETLGRDVLFFEDGAFSQGSIQLAPNVDFGVEFGFINDDRRLRLVQIFSGIEGRLLRLTLIREKKVGRNAIERPPLTVNQLFGEWRGEGVTLYADWRASDSFFSSLKVTDLGEGRVSQQLSFDMGNGLKTVSSTGLVEGNEIKFERNTVMLFPDGASANIPHQIKLGEAFFLEAGWLVEPNLRLRMIRTYNDKGEWVSLTLLREKKVD